MKLPWIKTFDPEDAELAIGDYIEENLRARLDVAEGTPAFIEKLPSAPGVARRRVDFGRGRDMVVTFYPVEKKRERAKEHASIVKSLATRKVPVPEILAADFTKETRKTFRFEAVAESRFEARPSDDGWTREDLTGLADLFKRIHTISHPAPGRPWAQPPQKDDPASDWGKRWNAALETVATHLGKKLEPAPADVYRERALGRLDGADRFELVQSEPSPDSFARLRGGGMAVIGFSRFHFGFREWDLALLVDKFFKGRKTEASLLLDAYFSGQPQPVVRRYEALMPFFSGMIRIERAAETARVLPPMPSRGGSRSDKKVLEKFDQKQTAIRESALADWTAFLETTTLFEEGEWRQSHANKSKAALKR
jgi:hypothetical protein